MFGPVTAKELSGTRFRKEIHEGRNLREHIMLLTHAAPLSESRSSTLRCSAATNAAALATGVPRAGLRDLDGRYGEGAVDELLDV
jgi:hypothetical protein